MNILNDSEGTEISRGVLKSGDDDAIVKHPNFYFPDGSVVIICRKDCLSNPRKTTFIALKWNVR